MDGSHAVGGARIGGGQGLVVRSSAERPGRRRETHQRAVVLCLRAHVLELEHGKANEIGSAELAGRVIAARLALLAELDLMELA